jgi:hypothetical protein
VPLLANLGARNLAHFSAYMLEVDRLVGPRRRSEFFTEAAAEKLKREKLLQATRRAMSLPAELDVSGWETPEAASKWVHDLRVESDRKRNV